MGVYAATAHWDAGTVTWNTRPNVFAFVQYVNVGAGSGWGEYDVSTVGQRWPGGGVTKEGFVVKANTSGSWMRSYRSRNHGSGDPYRAYLVVGYDLPTPTSTGTRTFTRTATRTFTQTATVTRTPTWTPAGTVTRAYTATRTAARTATLTATKTVTSTDTTMRTSTATATPSRTRASVPTHTNCDPYTHGNSPARSGPRRRPRRHGQLPRCPQFRSGRRGPRRPGRCV